MRLIGYWIESLEDPHYFPPQEFVADLHSDLHARLADYLDGGQEFARYRGASWCRFFCGRAMSSSELTDGYWVWPADLSHYVRDHHVSLPEEFVRHVLAPPPTVAKSLAWYAARPDLEFWREWCRTHSNGKLLDSLAAARGAADQAARRVLETAAAEVETALGVAVGECRTAGCQHRAVCGRPFCGRCLVGRDRHLHVGHLYTDLRAVLAQ